MPLRACNLIFLALAVFLIKFVSNLMQDSYFLVLLEYH